MVGGIGPIMTVLPSRKLPKRVLKTADYTADLTDNIIGVDSSGGIVKITLPSAAVAASNGNQSHAFIVKDEGGAASTNNITIDTEGAETIDGAATSVINANYASRGFYSDGTDWFTV